MTKIQNSKLIYGNKKGIKISTAVQLFVLHIAGIDPQAVFGH